MNLNEIKELFKECNLDGNKIIIKYNLYQILKFAKDKYSYNILKEIIANDKQKEGIELTYHLYSTEDEEDLLVTIIVKDKIESISDLFESAIADEREIFDMFGVKFINHKDLKRLYMPDSWEGHPLKKDYVQNDERLAWNDNNIQN